MIRICFSVLSMIALAAGCASVPNEEERSAALAAEAFTADYRVAVTSVMKKPDVSSFIGGALPLSGLGLAFNVGSSVAEGGAAKHTGEMSPLEKIDAAMVAALEAELGVKAELLPRESYGGDELAPKISNIAFDALTEAKSQGYDAMLFVHLQPELASATGGGKRRLSLTGTPVFRSTAKDTLMYFNDTRLECAGYEPISDDDLPEAMKVCTDQLVAQLSRTFSSAVSASS